ncbi:MAG: hypothetical protein V1922_03130 [bacterium]
MNIIPSLVEQTARDLFDRITFLSPHYHQFQIDIEDGVFIQNKTLSTNEFVTYTLDHKDKLSGATLYDFHLMVCDPENHLKAIALLPPKSVGIILMHKTVFPDYSLITSHYPLFKFGLVLNPEDEVSDVSLPLIQALSVIQLMTVNPGRQGQPFIKDVLNKIEQLRNRGFQGKIYIDGAINETTLPLIISLPHKPDVLCPGSYLAKAPGEDLERRVNLLTIT